MTSDLMLEDLGLIEDRSNSSLFKKPSNVTVIISKPLNQENASTAVKQVMRRQNSGAQLDLSRGSSNLSILSDHSNSLLPDMEMDLKSQVIRMDSNYSLTTTPTRLDSSLLPSRRSLGFHHSEGQFPNSVMDTADESLTGLQQALLVKRNIELDLVDDEMSSGCTTPSDSMSLRRTPSFQKSLLPPIDIPRGLAPGEEFLVNVNEDNLDTFLWSGVPKNFLVLNQIIKNNKIYEMYFEGPKRAHQPLLYAVRRRKGKYVSYYIALSVEDLRTQRYICRVKGSDFSGSRYELLEYAHDGTELPTPRGSIRFASRRFAHVGPRQVTLSVPLHHTLRPHSVHSNMSSESTGSMSNFLAKEGEHFNLVNAVPQWSEQTKSYALNFNGRAPVASKKNIQLIKDGDSEGAPLFQLGKTGKDSYNVDFRYPVNVVQAFAFALTQQEGSITEAL